MPTEPELHDTAIVTIRHYRDIQQAIKKGRIDFTENVRWVAAEKMLKELDPEVTVLPVLLADATSEQRGIMAWGIASKITITGSQTRIILRDVKEILSRPLISTLYCQSTEDYLSREDQRNYRIVDTPPYVYDAPKTFLLTWNPKKQVSIEQFQAVRQTLIEGKSSEWTWTCYSTQKAMPGDRFLMLRLGGEPRGIVGCGWLRSYSDVSEENDTPHADILWDWMVDPEAPLNPLTIPGADQYRWSPQKSGGMELHEDISETVWEAWIAWTQKDIDALPPLLSENDPEDEDEASLSSVLSDSDECAPEDTASSLEGRLIESWSTRRERDPANRALCLSLHEPRCVVCEMSFLEEYGEIGRDFIHVHHERPLAGADADKGDDYHAGDDLKPVCPNCHAMLHRGLDARQGQVRSISELRSLRAAAKGD